MTKVGTPLIVLGMHRSGTSLLAGALYNLGIHLGDEKNLMGAQKDVNAKGFWEHEKIVAIHDEIFSVFGLHWDKISALPAHWQHDERVKPYREVLVDIIKTEFSGHDLWGIKDPRMCRLLPLWHSIFEELNITPKFLFIGRHPFEVAASLVKRDSLPWQYSLYLWIRYFLEAEEFSVEHQRSWLTYEALNKDWKSTISRVGSDLDIEWPRSVEGIEVQAKMADLVTDSLWHNKSADLLEKYSDESVCTLELYEAFLIQTNASEKKNKDRDRIQRVREKLAPVYELVSQATASWNDLVSALKKENTALVEQREDFAAVNKELLNENILLVEYRDKLNNRLDIRLLLWVRSILK